MKMSLIMSLPIIEIDNFCSSNECDAMLEKRWNGFKSALSHYPTYYRNNDRLVEDSPNLSRLFFKKLMSLNIQGLNDIKGINNRVRFCRYQKNQLFSKHQDGVHYLSDNYESKYTFLLYLNHQDDFIGGDTEFYTSKYDENPYKVVTPEKGKLLIFDHRIWHQGAKIILGNKYILRSDVYVSRNVESNHHDGYIWNLLKVDDRHFLSCGRDTTIKLWNKELQLLKIFKLHSKSVIKITKLNDKEFISCSRDFTLKKWTNSGKVLSSICLNEMLLNIAVHTSEKQVVAVGTSGKVFVLNSELTLLKTIKVHKHWVWGITWIDNDVVTCGEDGSVSITNITTSTTKCILKFKEALYSMYCNKEFIFLGTKNGTVIKLSRSKNKLENLYLHKDIVRSILYYKNQIISCGEDNRIMRYNILNGHKEQIREANNFIQDSIILNGQIYAAGFDGRITIDNI